MKTIAMSVDHPAIARFLRLHRSLSSRNAIPSDPRICDIQYTRLFRDRARMLNNAPL